MDFTLKQDGVEIRISGGPYLQDGHPTDRAVIDYTSLISKLDQIRGFAADNLLELYNKTWLISLSDIGSKSCWTMERQSMSISSASKPLVPTRKGDAPLLAAQPGRWAS
jgi:hypothetical protein